MTQLKLQKAFAPIKRHAPKWLSNPIRSAATASLAPLIHGYRTGFFLSAFKMKAVARDGSPLPWYTYPSIEFLKYRTYENKLVLEFGGGQSSLWWAQRAKQIVTLEGDHDWYAQIKQTMPANVDLHLVSMKDVDANTREVKEVLASKHYRHYDVVVIDGLYRYQMIDIACDVLAIGGFIVCDNAEGYGFYEGFKDRGLNRVDFYGNAPGVVLPHCTSLYYRTSSFIFDSSVPIHVVAKE